MQKYWPGIVFLVLFFIVAGFGIFVFGGVFPRRTMIPLPPRGIAQCTMEARLCPDGTSVGRTGPTCEFAPCPTSPTPAGPPIAIPNPDTELQTTYIHGQEWPPKTEIKDSKFSCTDQKIKISGQDYCKRIVTQGAAGSRYETYTYTTPYQSSKTLTASFVLQKVQCENYEEPEKSACEKERAAFDIDALIHKYLQEKSPVIDGQL